MLVRLWGLRDSRLLRNVVVRLLCAVGERMKELLALRSVGLSGVSLARGGNAWGSRGENFYGGCVWGDWIARGT